MKPREIAEHIIKYNRWTDDFGIESNEYLLAQAYLSALSVIEAARKANLHWIDNGQFGERPDKVQIPLREALKAFDATAGGGNEE